MLGLQGARERRSGHLDNSIALMNAALGQPGLPKSLRRFLLLHRAHALRVAGRYADGAADYKLLWQAPGDFSQDAGYWLADYSFLQGRFGEALSNLDQLTDVSAELRGEILRLRGPRVPGQRVVRPGGIAATARPWTWRARRPTSPPRARLSPT